MPEHSTSAKAKYCKRCKLILVNTFLIIFFKNMQLQGQIENFWKGGSHIYIKGVGVHFADFISFFSKYPMNMK